MPKERPKLSITLPKNFTFHYTEGDAPKTPEREAPAAVPESPRPAGPYRIKRRARPTASSIFAESSRSALLPRDQPLPSIESPVAIAPSRSLFNDEGRLPKRPQLTPIFAQRARTLPRMFALPRTPEPKPAPSINEWKRDPQDIGESLTRPLSTCSLLSDSSDESSRSLGSFAPGEGSCTSPESDAPDPFRFASIRKTQSKRWVDLLGDLAEHPAEKKSKPNPIRWTPEMDRHLWSTYVLYLQDPTVTPFKMLPGVAPPLGVCHRVARQARKTWRGARSLSSTPSALLSPITFNPPSTRPRDVTPTSAVATSAQSERTEASQPGPLARPTLWPKSGSSTRRRLRFLCKQKPTFAPHYQRMAKSRSPSPFSSSMTSVPRSRSRLSESSVPPSAAALPSSSPFNSRDVQISLTTTTADSMQPDGPLAQLSSSSEPASQQDHVMTEEWFNEPPVPFASEIPVPSSDGTAGAGSSDATAANPAHDLADPFSTPRLGSPFGYHTWGPSRSKRRLRPSIQSPGLSTGEARTIGPSLRSPLQIYDPLPLSASGVPKRRARHQLEDELSPGGSNVAGQAGPSTTATTVVKNEEVVIETPHRRVRSRGFSLGAPHVNSNGNPLEALFSPPETRDDAGMIGRPASPSLPARRLDSPFEGVAPRPTRRFPRRMAALSLGAYDGATAESGVVFSSIGEAINRPDSGH